MSDNDGQIAGQPHEHPEDSPALPLENTPNGQDSTGPRPETLPPEASPTGEPSAAPPEVAAETPIETPPETPAETHSQADADDAPPTHVSLLFRDGLDLPIQGLDFIVTLPSGLVCTATSTAQGAITLPVESDRSGQARVEVKDEAGKRQEVCSIDLARCKNAAIIRSPKVKAPLPLRPHQQKPPAPARAAPKAQTPSVPAPKQPDRPAKVDTSTPWWDLNGALARAWERLVGAASASGPAPAAARNTPVAGRTLNSAGNPVSVIAGPECPNPQALRLGRNNVYRQAILDAAKRLGLIPQALCALMDCEAGKVPEKIPKLDAKGNPLKDKQGRPMTTTVRELWNANAGNAQSGAAGLTQFLASTWLAHVMLPGYYIHDQSEARGWVKQETNAKGKTYWAFVLADGTTTTKPYAKRKTDANVQACLAMRMDPTWSINAAADYGAANLKVLEQKGFKLSALANDMDKAKLMYLMHHEGEGAGPAFISNTLGKLRGGTTGLKSKFATQLGGGGAAKAQKFIDAEKGDIELAYRKWLASYIDKNFARSNKYFCSNPIASSELSLIMESVGGSAI